MIPPVVLTKNISVIVDGAGAIENFILAIAVYITHRHLVIALPGIELIAGCIAVECPAMRELTIAPIPGHTNEACVIASAHYQAWPGAIEIGNYSNETIYPVSVIIARKRNGYGMGR